MHNKVNLKSSFLVLVFFFNLTLLTAGEVYLVIGSDTAIWDGMSVRRYHCYYNKDLYTNPVANAFQVMDPSFRQPFVDSYGQPLKMTWWMMAGNIFRYADNKNVPIPNIMTLYLMKKYHGENVAINGDELSLHYHTFFWSDYDQDGIFYWNQSKKFRECLDDFNFTLVQFLLEEQIFPVSFRSGWHYMDNEWQNYLDNYILPYSLHNDFPSNRIDETEPLDNTYNWSLAPSQFVPFHPSPQNYQIPGEGPGWNVRSAHLFRTRYYDLMDSIFSAASKEGDQVACLWGHLPETDFLTNVEIIDSLAHKMAAKYPTVKFRYCTAIEAMQRWRKSNDSVAPNIEFTEIAKGDSIAFQVQTDEQIFQRQPFVAIKDIYEQYSILPCVQTGINRWETTKLFSKNLLAKAGVTVCDTMGNQAMEFIYYRPDDIFIDNLDDGYSESYGNWSAQNSKYDWGINARIAPLTQQDSAKVVWNYSIEDPGYYNVFIQIPNITNAAVHILFSILQNHQNVDSVQISSSLPTRDWIYLSTVNLKQGDELTVEMSANGKTQPGKYLAADVLKLSALVREKDIVIKEALVDFGEISVFDTVKYNLPIINQGIETLHVQEIQFNSKHLFTTSNFPIPVPAMSKIDIPLFLVAEEKGPVLDTLSIKSDDPSTSILKIPIHGNIQNYFEIIDNEDPFRYKESGLWHFSNAQAYGQSSRYSYLNANPKAFAAFTAKVKKGGVFQIFIIVPKTVNASNNALYEFRIDNTPVDSVYIDQNQNSGGWVTIGNQHVSTDSELQVRVIDTGKSTVGVVLRADAIKFQLTDQVVSADEINSNLSPKVFGLMQNYPNPFNPATLISYQIPKLSHVKIEVFDLLGKRIKMITNEVLPPGFHSVKWDGTDSNQTQVASGIYCYRIRAGNFVQTKKMMFLH